MSATGERGATLIEAMVALAILALVSAVTYPAMERGYGRLELRRATERLAADLRVARGMALKRGAPVVLALSADGTSYAVGPIQRASVAANVTFGGSPRVAFFPDGSASGGRIIVANRGREAQVAVDPATGALLTGGL